MNRVYRALEFAALLALAAFSSVAVGQAYPSKPIRFVAAFPAGGPSDMVTRAIGKRMAEILGQPVIVENRAGAAGNIGAEFVARSAPDGYTLLLGGSFVTIAPSLYRKLPFDPVKDFAPVGLIVTNQYLLVVHPSVPATTVNELIRLAKGRPGKMNYASAGIGSPPHLSAELFKTMAGLEIVHVPYKGASPALVDLIGGQVDLYFGGISGALPHAKAGKLRALAVTGGKRSSQLPEVPTVAEAALPGYEISTWFGLVAPAGTPREVVARLNSVITTIVNEAETKSYLIGQGVEPLANTPEQFAAFIRDEISKFARIVQAAGIKPE